MNAKFFKTLVIILNVLMVAGIAALLIVMNLPEEKEANAKEPTLDEMVENSFQTSEMSTDLKDGSFVRIQFQVITDSEKAKEEMKKREFQLQNMLIKEMAKMDREAFRTGLSDLEKRMADKLNEKMEEGKIINIYTINKVLQ